jgi:DnaJ-class molecular chaperone
MNENYYNILDIPETASLDEIKKSYRKLSMLYHPDKNKNNPEATSKFQKISEAYETLGDIDKRKEYDAMRNNPFIKMMHSSGGGGQNPMEDLFANLFSGNMMQGFPPGVRIFHNGIPINAHGFAQKPTPIIKNIIIPIDKILSGTTVPIDIERWIIQDGNKVFEHENIYVTIPKGIDEGEMIILREKGNIAREDCVGDIKIFVKIENNTEFKRSGLDLIYEKIITVKEALCGFTFELKYITGKIYTINNQSGNIISHGYRKIIPNMGFSRDQHCGNLIIVFNIKFPDKLTEDTMEQLRKIEF